MRVVPKGFAERWDVGWEKEKEVKTDSSFQTRAPARIKSLKWRRHWVEQEILGKEYQQFSFRHLDLRCLLNIQMRF